MSFTGCEVAVAVDGFDPSTATFVRVGRRGGLLRPSTGFAVDRIARDAARIRRSLERHGHPHAGRSRRARHRLPDRLLVDVIGHDPDRIEAVFAALFARNPPARVLRFLDEDTSPAEEAALVATLPPWPFLRAARRVLAG
jgi:lycopene beta-cyclase